MLQDTHTQQPHARTHTNTRTHPRLLMYRDCFFVFDNQLSKKFSTHFTRLLATKYTTSHTFPTLAFIFTYTLCPLTHYTFPFFHLFPHLLTPDYTTSHACTILSCFCLTFFLFASFLLARPTTHVFPNS